MVVNVIRISEELLIYMCKKLEVPERTKKKKIRKLKHHRPSTLIYSNLLFKAKTL